MSDSKPMEIALDPNFKDVPAPFDPKKELREGDPFIFVSYSHHNKAQVYPVLDYLHNEKKFHIWYDPAMECGVQDFRDELRRKIESCTAVLLFVSKESMSSIYCGMEIIVAQENQKPFYIVRLDKTEYPPAFEILLGKIHAIDGTNPQAAGRDLKDVLPPETMERLIYEGNVLTSCEHYGATIEIGKEASFIGDSAFHGNLTLENISFPETIRAIGKESFRGCTNLTEILIPYATERIGESAFRDCTSLKKLVVQNQCIKIGERAFENCSTLEDVQLPEGLTEIYGGVFNSCRGLKHITLPKMLTVLGESAFSDCSSLTDIDIPASVTKIDDLVFNGCTKLTTITLHEGLKKIGKGAFKNCSVLEEVEIPASVSLINDAVFRGCKALFSIKVSPKNKHYKSELTCLEGSRSHVLFNKNKSILLAYPGAVVEQDYTVPDSVVTISDWAFCEARNLSKVIIPDSVQSIGEGAFCNCTNLLRVSIPDSVTQIDDCAFRGCSGLKEIHIPSSVVEFGWGVFDGCDEQLKVYCEMGSAIDTYCKGNRINTVYLDKVEA